MRRVLHTAYGRYGLASRMVGIAVLVLSSKSTALGFTNKAVNQGAAKPLVETERSARRGGCAVSGEGGVGSQLIPLQARDYWTSRLFQETSLLQEGMAVSTRTFVFGGTNAFSSPEHFVALGMGNWPHIAETRGAAAGWQGLGFILAHEFGHQVQFKKLGPDMGGRPTPRTELQADCLGAYWVGMRLREQETQGVVSAFEAAAVGSMILAVAFDIGDTHFKDPQHHGTPSERRGQVSRGLAAGHSFKFGEPGDFVDGLFEFCESTDYQ